MNYRKIFFISISMFRLIRTNIFVFLQEDFFLFESHMGKWKNVYIAVESDDSQVFELILVRRVFDSWSLFYRFDDLADFKGRITGFYVLF